MQVFVTYSQYMINTFVFLAAQKIIVSRESMSDTNQAVQPQKIARCLNIRIVKQRGCMYVTIVKTKALICAFDFAHAKIKFSYVQLRNALVNCNHCPRLLWGWGIAELINYHLEVSLYNKTHPGPCRNPLMTCFK